MVKSSRANEPERCHGVNTFGFLSGKLFVHILCAHIHEDASRLEESVLDML